MLIAIFACGCNLNDQTPSSESNTTNDVQRDETDNVQRLEKDFSGTYQTEYEALVIGYSDSVPSAQHEIEYEFADHENSILGVKQKVSVTVNGKKSSGDYLATEFRSYNYYPEFQYQDENKDTFTIDDTGMLTSYFWGTPSQKKTPLTMDACLQIAKDFVGEIVDIDSYRISIEDEKAKERYVVSFEKYVNGIKTTDSASVTVQYDGTLYSYSSFMLGRVSDGVAVSESDIKSAASSIIKKLNLIYVDAKKQYSRVEYGAYSYTLSVLKDGSTALIWYVNVDCVNEYADYDQILSERIRFVVALN